MASGHGGRDTTGSLCFAVKGDPLHKIEKPYLHNYIAKGVPRTNLAYHRVDGIEIRDLRTHPLTYREHGIEVTELATSLAYEDFDDVAKVETCYLREAREAIRRALGTDEVYIWQYRVRNLPIELPSYLGQKGTTCG
jgi:hypothetical protein